jgi:HD-GYP domain-containing protein (c-di-GMP phosphodiesterase class II)
MPVATHLEQRLAEYETLLEIGVELASTLDLERVLELALRKAEEVCRAETGSIWELDAGSQELFFRVVRGRAAPAIPRPARAGGRRDRRQRRGARPARSGERRRGGPALARRHRSRVPDTAILTVPLIAHGSVVGVLQLLNPVGKEGFSPDDEQRMKLFAGPLAHAIDNARLYAAQKRLFVETVTALAEAIEKRDPYTGGHVHRVVCYSLLLGAQLGLDREELARLRLSATLHDVGKIAVPDRVLNKPAPLDRDEFEIMKRHTLDGAEIVSTIQSLHDVLPGVRSHHERLDGRGYPDGLFDADIPELARIIAVADTFDAMTTSRPYRAGMSPEVAAAELARGAGTQHCPRVVGAFEALFGTGGFNLEAGRRLLASLSEESNQG